MSDMAVALILTIVCLHAALYCPSAWTEGFVVPRRARFQHVRARKEFWTKKSGKPVGGVS